MSALNKTPATMMFGEVQYGRWEVYQLA